MHRAILRSATRASGPARHLAARPNARRFLTTAPADKPRTWKGSGLRWGLAIGALYWYNTSPLFADELQSQTIPPPPQFSDSDLPTVEAIVQEKRKQADAKLQSQQQLDPLPQSPIEHDMVAAEIEPSQAQSPEELEQQADQQGAFNPETGEINWDCPCLGGMAHGPCGEEFKAAFSCFVYSTEEPKGMDCIDKFQHMQDCFRLHPEIYGSEIDDDTASPEADGEEAPAFAAKDKTQDDMVSELEENASGSGAALAVPKENVAKPDTATEPISSAGKTSSNAAAEPAVNNTANAELTLASPAKVAKLESSTEEPVVPVDAFDATEANNQVGLAASAKDQAEDKEKKAK